MNLQYTRILLTGAAGGIGSALAEQLGAAGARLALVDRDAETLQSNCAALREQGYEAHPMNADLSNVNDCQAAVEVTSDILGGVDILINAAGLMSFTSFAEEDPMKLDLLMRVNLLAPMHLSRSVLPQMLTRNSGKIVNIGSIFGSIGFAWFAAYSSSKFGMRGFSQSLRRELADSDISISYIAPRAVNTPINTEAVMRMAEATGMQFDEADVVADRIVQAIENDEKDVYIGWPESLFVRINAILPRLVDRVLRDQNRKSGSFAT
ncbi:MAG: SDR family oxidoreductase, partial [Mariprofundales bacterium]